jgi:lipooligosaccharide transport system permease protein
MRPRPASLTQPAPRPTDCVAPQSGYGGAKQASRKPAYAPAGEEDRYSLRDLHSNAISRWFSVWQRNALAWKCTAKPALLAGFAEPLFYLFAMGYGLGNLIGQVEGMSYIAFLTAGIISSSAMNAATFEGLYLAYTRLSVEGVWDSMLCAPLDVVDIVMGELMWMGSKSTLNASLILIVAAAAGLATSWLALLVLPIAFLAGICFGSMALIMTALAQNFSFFVYYITLVSTPMILLSGVFFPVSGLPESARIVISLLPLQPVVTLIRQLLAGHAELHNLAWTGLLVPLSFAVVSTGIAIWLLKRRLQG